MSHLTLENRKLIASMITQGKKFIDIAITIGYNPTTIAKETKKNRIFLNIGGWINDSGQMTTHFNILSMEDSLNQYLQRIDSHPHFLMSMKNKFSKFLLVIYENDMQNRENQNKLLFSSIKTLNS